MASIRTNIYELVGESSIISLVSLFAPLTFGLYWKKASATGALLSMVLGTFTWFVFEQMESGWPSLVPGLLVSVAAMIIGSRVWSKKI